MRRSPRDGRTGEAPRKTVVLASPLVRRIPVVLFLAVFVLSAAALLNPGAALVKLAALTVLLLAVLVVLEVVSSDLGGPGAMQQ